MLGGHSAIVATAEFSPDGRRVVTASRDNTAVVWIDRRTRTRCSLGTQLLSLVGDRRSRLTENASYQQSLDKIARYRDAAVAQEVTLLSGHTQVVQSAVFSPDGRRVVTASDDKTARIWDAASGRQIGLLTGHRDKVMDAVFSPDDRHVATASEDALLPVCIWDAFDNREQPRRAAAAAHKLAGRRRLLVRRWVPDGHRIWLVNNARIWDTGPGRELPQLKGHTALVLSAEFSPDGRRVVTASDDGTARVWDAATGGELIRLAGHTQQVEGAVFSPDGARIVTASYDHTARVWDAATGRQLVILSGHTAQVNWAGFSPDGRRIVTSSFDKTARIWEAESGRQLMIFRGHTGSVATAAFSPDGARLVTASDDKTARVWETATGREVMVLIGHSRVLTSAAFSPDGGRIVTSSNRAGLHDLWDGGGRDNSPWRSASGAGGRRRVLAGWSTHRHRVGRHRDKSLCLGCAGPTARHAHPLGAGLAA